MDPNRSPWMRLLPIPALWLFILALLALVAPSGLAPMGQAEAREFQIGDRLAPAAPQRGARFRETSWDDLLPKTWDPMKIINELQLDQLEDSDPRAIEAMEKLQRMWNKAPANPEMNGRSIRIAGFMVPLEWGQREVREFLLVPYFGACIHVPPPPANQIIHVRTDRPYRPRDVMDAVWVSGVIELAKTRTVMGDSGYRLRAVRVEPYKAPPGR